MLSGVFTVSDDSFSFLSVSFTLPEPLALDLLPLLLALPLDLLAVSVDSSSFPSVSFTLLEPDLNFSTLLVASPLDLLVIFRTIVFGVSSVSVFWVPNFDFELVFGVPTSSLDFPSAAELSAIDLRRPFLERSSILPSLASSVLSPDLLTDNLASTLDLRSDFDSAPFDLLEEAPPLLETILKFSVNCDYVSGINTSNIPRNDKRKITNREPSIFTCFVDGSEFVFALFFFGLVEGNKNTQVR